MIINNVYSQVVEDILSESIGKTGDLFFTAEEVMEKYSVSYVTALRLIQKLIDGKYLISIGNKKFIMNGLYSKYSPLYSLIDSPQKKIGIIIQDITNPFFSSITASLPPAGAASASGSAPRSGNSCRGSPRRTCRRSVRG